MEFQTREVEGITVVDLPQELADARREDLEKLREFCHEMQENGQRDFVFNMNKLTSAPSMVLGTLIVIQKRIKGQEGRMAMSEISETLKKIFAITGIDRIIDTYDDEVEAVKSFCATK